MKKTFTISLGHSVFNVEEDAQKWEEREPRKRERFFEKSDQKTMKKAYFPQCFWRLSIQTTMAPKEFEPPVHTIPVDS